MSDKTLWARSTPETTVLSIYPQMAQMMLNTSTGNRKVRGIHVKRLAEAMLRGEWRVTSQGIGFDVTGALRDGHHRLHAIVQSGVTVELPIVLGMPMSAYQVTDTGLRRTYADLLGEDRKIAEILTFGAQILHAQMVPTVDQILVLQNSPLYDVANRLYSFCSITRRNFSTAPVRLAACVEILNGGREAFVLEQYRALCVLDFDNMTQSARAYVRQMELAGTGGKRTAREVSRRREQLVRALRVFDEDRKHVTKIQINESTTASMMELVRSVLGKTVEHQLEIA